MPACGAAQSMPPCSKRLDGAAHMRPRRHDGPGRMRPALSPTHACHQLYLTAKEMTFPHKCRPALSMVQSHSCVPPAVSHQTGSVPMDLQGLPTPEHHSCLHLKARHAAGCLMPASNHSCLETAGMTSRFEIKYKRNDIECAEIARRSSGSQLPLKSCHLRLGCWSIWAAQAGMSLHGCLFCLLMASRVECSTMLVPALD